MIVMKSSTNNLRQIFAMYAYKYRYYLIGVIIFFAALLIFLGVKEKTSFKDSFNYYVFDGSVYNDEKYNIKYDDKNNIVYFDSSDDDDYTISYKYSYNNDKISNISFEGTYFSSDIKGEINFEYVDNNISIIKAERIFHDVENVDYYVFHYDDSNRVIKVDHDKGGIWKSTAESPYGCNYYYYEKYVISDCHNTEIYQPNLKESYSTDYYKRSIYVDDESIRNNKNLWIANNITPFIYYGLNFPRDISSDVTLLGSSYDVPYNPGKLLYSVSKKNNTLNNKTEVSASKIYYSNGNIIKEEYGEKLDIWNITMFEKNKRVSSIDSMNNNYEFLYTYKKNDIVQKKKLRNNYSTLVNKYNEYFKSAKLDHNIDNIIEDLDNIIQKLSNDRLPALTINTLLEEQSISNKQTVDYDFSFSGDSNIETVSISFNGENVIGNNVRDSNCRTIRNSKNEYTCKFILNEGANNVVVTAKDSNNKQTIKNYTINFIVPEPSIKIENDYYKVAINDNHWRPRFVLSDNIDNYEVTWYFDNQKWSRSQTFDYVETRDEGILYSVWIPGIIIGTKSADPGIHTMKVEIRDKRTDKVAFDEATIECY